MAYSALRTLVNRAGITFDALKTHVVFAEDMNQIKDNIEYLESNRSALSTILNFANLGSGYLMRWDGSKLVNSKVYNNGTNVGIGTTNPLGSLHVANTSNNYVYLDSVAGGYNQLFFRDATTLKYQFGKLNDNTFGLYNSAAGVYSILTDASSNINLNAGQVYVQKSSGNVGIATSNPTAKADINSDILRLRTAKTPATAGAAGNQGDMCWDSGFLYICVSTNAWVRSALATW